MPDHKNTIGYRQAGYPGNAWGKCAALQARSRDNRMSESNVNRIANESFFSLSNSETTGFNEDEPRLILHTATDSAITRFQSIVDTDSTGNLTPNNNTGLMHNDGGALLALQHGRNTGAGTRVNLPRSLNENGPHQVMPFTRGSFQATSALPTNPVANTFRGTNQAISNQSALYRQGAFIFAVVPGGDPHQLGDRTYVGAAPNVHLAEIAHAAALTQNFPSDPNHVLFGDFTMADYRQMTQLEAHANSDAPDASRAIRAYGRYLDQLERILINALNGAADTQPSSIANIDQPYGPPNPQGPAQPPAQPPITPNIVTNSVSLTAAQPAVPQWQARQYALNELQERLPPMNTKKPEVVDLSNPTIRSFYTQSAERANLRNNEDPSASVATVLDVTQDGHPLSLHFDPLDGWTPSELEAYIVSADASLLKMGLISEGQADLMLRQTGLSLDGLPGRINASTEYQRAQATDPEVDLGNSPEMFPHITPQQQGGAAAPQFSAQWSLQATEPNRTTTASTVRQPVNNSGTDLSPEPGSEAVNEDEDDQQRARIKIDIGKRDDDQLDDLVMLSTDQIMNTEGESGQRVTESIFVSIKNGEELGNNQIIRLSSRETQNGGRVQFQDPTTGVMKDHLVIVLPADGRPIEVNVMGTDVSTTANDVELIAEPLFRTDQISSDTEDMTVFWFDNAHLNVTKQFPYDTVLLADGNVSFHPVQPMTRNNSTSAEYSGGARITPELPPGAENTDPIDRLNLGFVQEILSEVRSPDGQTTLRTESEIRYRQYGLASQLGVNTNGIDVLMLSPIGGVPTTGGNRLTYSLPEEIAIQRAYAPNTTLIDSETPDSPFYIVHGMPDMPEESQFRGFDQDSSHSISSHIRSGDGPATQTTIHALGIPLLDEQGNHIDTLIYSISAMQVQIEFDLHLIVQDDDRLIPLAQHRWLVDAASDDPTRREATANPTPTRTSDRGPDLNAPLAESVQRNSTPEFINWGNFTITLPNRPGGDPP